MNLPPRLRFAHLPTPIEHLPRLSAQLGGAQIWIKRDDQTGLAGGGNKTRKLEYLLADAQQAGAKTIVTGGAPQSNHCRQTAAAAARFGFRCVLVLRGHPPEEITGNILLDHLLGADIVWTGDAPREVVMQAVFEREKFAGHQPYLIPIGGSNQIGAAAYAAAVAELAGQLQAGSDLPDSFTRICFASSSAGTHAGLAVGTRALMPQTIAFGLSVDERAEDLKTNAARIANETARLLRLPFVFEVNDIAANDEYIGGGYAVMGEREREAIRLLARLEGVLVDPVYTGKAFGGLIDLIRTGAIGKDEHVLFWHTGGQSALYAYSHQLL